MSAITDRRDLYLPALKLARPKLRCSGTKRVKIIKKDLPREANTLASSCASSCSSFGVGSGSASTYVTGNIYVSPSALAPFFLVEHKNEITTHTNLAITSSSPPLLETPIQHLDHITSLKIEFTNFLACERVDGAYAGGRVEIHL